MTMFYEFKEEEIPMFLRELADEYFKENKELHEKLIQFSFLTFMLIEQGKKYSPRDHEEYNAKAETKKTAAYQAMLDHFADRIEDFLKRGNLENIKFEITTKYAGDLLNALRHAKMPQWISCKDQLPDWREDIILYFHDTYHQHPSWPKMYVVPAWRANVGEKDTPEGLWAIEGRLGNYTVPIEDGIAWMHLPNAPEVENEKD